MILYFSATGNTEYIAQELAKRLDDECINLLDRVKKQDYSVLHSDKPYIICAPVYVCEMPRFMSKYLKKQTFTGNKDVYFIFTSGGYCGISGLLAKSIFRKKKMNYRGHAEFKMPSNYVANDTYSMSSTKEIENRIMKSHEKITSVVADITAGKQLTGRHICLFETIITVPFNPVWCKLKLRAKDFYSTDKCIGCGNCVKLCPLNNIKLENQKPIWNKNCTHCMACIGNCPTRAIEYGTITQDKEQYNFDKYRYVVDSLPDKNKN